MRQKEGFLGGEKGPDRDRSKGRQGVEGEPQWGMYENTMTKHRYFSSLILKQ